MNVLPKHYPEYLMEAVGLGLFMLSAAVVTGFVEHPDFPIRSLIANPMLRRGVIGVAMGLTAIAIIYSPWGKQSGAHLNPSVTLTFLRLGKIKPLDALGYITAQFIGGWVGVWLAARLLGAAIAHPAVNYVVTVPGSHGAIGAFLAELMISFGLMMVVLIVSNTPTVSRWTGWCAGVLVALYIILEAPLSGMSMNPARTVASALSAHTWTALWVYFIAPLTGMLLAAEVYVRVNGRHAVHCAKLHHDNHKRCIFHCGYRPQRSNQKSRLSDQLPPV